MCVCSILCCVFSLYRRGPNKYTRKWEDLDAYSRPARGGTVGRGGPHELGRGRGGKRTNMEDREEEFPALPGQDHENNRQPQGEY